ncbi:MAG: NAD(P)/FAD-dependent oxidoreductase [Bacteroidales bacterium]|nr:NAD(P)/FAD-dependent oxidoreductase [Bacteroidales bacterium]
MQFDVVIIGSGLGGLLCGNILSNEGYNVCIIEKNHKLGGSLQTFGRKGCIFNTGLNYTESLDDGQVLNQYFRYFGLLDKLPLRKLDEDGFDVINFRDGKYKLAMEHDKYRDTLLQYFPKEKNGLTKYLEQIRGICHSISLYTFSEKPFNIFENKALGIGAAEFIRSMISDPRLQNVIAGNNLLYAGHEKKTPLFVHALINNSFIESAWRIADGSHQLVKLLADKITGNGGTILRNAKAEKFIIENDRIKSVVLANGEQVEGNYFICNTHPAQLLSMTDSPKIRNRFSYRISTLEDTIGMFTTYLVFKKNTFPYFNYNFYHYNQDSVWIAGDYDLSKWPQCYGLLPTATSKSDYYAESASLITYMQYSELETWENTFTGNRGEDYIRFKNEKATLLLNALERQFPGITSCVETWYTSTPLTWRDYTGTRSGSAYGILKDYNKPLETMVLPRTKIPNLLLTGQNTNVHGILGVTIGSVVTCGEIIDIQQLMKKIRSA